MSELIINFSSFNEICFQFYLSYFSNFYARNVEETFASFFVFLRFVVLDPPLLLTLSSEIGLGSIMLKLKCFLQMFSILHFILDPKTLRFPCCRSFLGAKLVEEKPSEVRTAQACILGSAR